VARREDDNEDDATMIPAGDPEIGDLLRAMIEGEEVLSETECND
jgi:hypothetical protein